VEALDAIQYPFIINKKIRTKISISLSVSKIEFYYFHWNTKQNEKILYIIKNEITKRKMFYLPG
jgi:hypothetical protein